MHSRHSSARRTGRLGAPARPPARALRRTRRRRLGTLASAVALTLIAGFLLGGRDQDHASATAIAADFDRGNIISDTAFYDSAALADTDIQAFLTAHGSGCSGPLCLKNYVTTTGTRPADGLCKGYTGGPSQTAAQIIGGVARSCGISPKVLLVLVEKEEGLVSDTTPTAGQYRIATGYGCPDTAACDTTYYGFFNQLYSAARQFQLYTVNPARYAYKAHQYNTIYYNPDYACGSGRVYIADQATANLYNYTPYQPDAAAMANLYGLGDACSAYGNRNFWRLYTDWFGSPQAGSYLVRTPTNPTVYLLSGTSKYPIGDMATVASLAPLGSVGYVSQDYLDRRATGPMMRRIVLAQDGTVYFLDSGLRLPFTTCAMVADYGGSCGSLITLEQTQIDAFRQGAFITPIYRTTSGKTFYVTGGTKREAVDDQALAQASMLTSSVTLAESGLDYLPYGTPVTRDGVAMKDRSTGAITVSAGGTFTAVSGQLWGATALSALPVRPMDDASMRLLPPASTVTGPIVTQAGTTTAYLLTPQGKVQLTDPAMLPATPQTVPAATLGLVPNAGTLGAGQFVKGAARTTIYRLQGGLLRPIGSWADLVSLSGGNPYYVTYDQRLVDLLPVGQRQQGPGTLVVAPSSTKVYFVNGTSELIPLSSWTPPYELGSPRLVYTTDAAVAAYTVRPAVLTMAVDCGGAQQYLGVGGKLYQVGADVAAPYHLTYTSLDPLTCAALPKAPIGLTRFLRGADGAIYYVDAGAKHWIRSYGTYAALGGAPANTIQADSDVLGILPTGAPY